MMPESEGEEMAEVLEGYCYDCNPCTHPGRCGVYHFPVKRPYVITRYDDLHVINKFIGCDHAVIEHSFRPT